MVKKPVGPLIKLFYGPDEYNKNKTIQTIIKETLGNNVSDLNLESYYSDDVDISQILEKAYIEPFFSGNRVIIIKFLNIKHFEDLNNDNKKILVEYIEFPSQHSIIILSIYGDVSRKPTGFLSEIIKSGQKNFESVEFKPPKDFEINSFIREKCRINGKTMDGTALSLLIEKSENDLSNIDNELDKLFLYTDKRNTINSSDIEGIIIDTREKNIFDLTNAIGAKKLNESLVIFDNIVKYMKRDEEIIMIIGAILKHLRRIWIAKSFNANGKKEYEIAKALKTKEYFVHNLLKEINRFSFDNLYKCFERTLKSDLDIKTTDTPAKFVVERLILDLCSI